MSAGVGELVVASTVAALTREVVDAGLASLTHRLRGNGRWIDAARDLLPVIVASVPLYAPAVTFLVLAYRDISPWTLPLFFAPALARPALVLAVPGAAEPGRDLSSLNEQLKAANLSFRERAYRDS